MYWHVNLHNRSCHLYIHTGTCHGCDADEHTQSTHKQNHEQQRPSPDQRVCILPRLQILKNWYPTADELDKKGAVLVMTAGEDIPYTLSGL
jgi:hypothetical protein